MICLNTYGQDGSDIRYLKIEDVDDTIIGEDLQFDFFNRSFGGRVIDTIYLSIDNKSIKFVEVRKDNGYTNWFSEQDLRSVDLLDEMKMRISKFNLNNITSTSYQVTIYIDFYNAENKLLMDKSRQIQYWFDKKDIIEVLLKSK